MPYRKVFIPVYTAVGFGAPDQGLPPESPGAPDQGLPPVSPGYHDQGLPGYPDQGLPPVSPGYPDQGLPPGAGGPIVSHPIYLPGRPTHPIYPVGGSPGHPSHQPIYGILRPVDPGYGKPEGPPTGCDGVWVPVDPGYGFPILGWLPIDPGWGRPQPGRPNRPDNSLPSVPGRPDNSLPEGGWVPIDPGFGVGRVPVWVWLPILLSGMNPPTPPDSSVPPDPAAQPK